MKTTIRFSDVRWFCVGAVLWLLCLPSRSSRGTRTPRASSTFWAPSTPYVQPYKVLHVTYDTYFGSRAIYPIDTGLTMGVFPGQKLQA